MPKKPITPVIEEDEDVLDDETFAELAADEERLHVLPSRIRSPSVQVKLPVSLRRNPVEAQLVGPRQ